MTSLEKTDEKLKSSARTPAGGAYSAPPDTLIGWRGEYPLPRYRLS